MTERLHAFCCRSRFKGFITSKNNAYEEKMIREEKTLPFFLEDITSLSWRKLVGTSWLDSGNEDETRGLRCL